MEYDEGWRTCNVRYMENIRRDGRPLCVGMCQPLVQDKFPTLQYLIKSYITWGVTNELLAVAHLSNAAVHLCAPDDAGKANKAHYFLRVCSETMSLFWGVSSPLPSHSWRQISTSICFSVSCYSENSELPEDGVNYYNLARWADSVSSIINDFYT